MVSSGGVGLNTDSAPFLRAVMRFLPRGDQGDSS
jgi:hypothetical protein